MTRKQKPQVVIVGGSFAGRTAFRELRDEFEVRLIESKEYFEYTPSVLRCLVEPDHALKTVLSQPSSITVATVVHFDSKRVELSNGEFIGFDYCLFCVGASYGSPIRPNVEHESRLETRVRVLREESSRIKSAKKIIIIGGGTVGVEFAAELIAVSKNDKQITLITSKDKLLERMPLKAQSFAQKWLENAGVTLVFNERVVNNNNGIVVTNTGKQFEAELVYECLGNKPTAANSIHFRLEDSEVDQSWSGPIRVNPHTLQVEGFDNVFACGDCTKTVEEKNAFAADLSAKLAAKNIKLHLLNKPLLTYPEGICQGQRSVPQVVCVSLYKYCAILQVNGLVITGAVPALSKAQIEFMQLAVAKERSWALFLWNIMESFIVRVSKYF
eukprot:g2522.t1